MTAAEFIFWFVALYLLVGLAFGILFAACGASAVDPSARGAGFRFRLMILPGTAALWPLLMTRWIDSINRKGGRP